MLVVVVAEAIAARAAPPVAAGASAAAGGGVGWGWSDTGAVQRGQSVHHAAVRLSLGQRRLAAGGRRRDRTAQRRVCVIAFRLAVHKQIHGPFHRGFGR